MFPTRRDAFFRTCNIRSCNSQLRNDTSFICSIQAGFHLPHSCPTFPNCWHTMRRFHIFSKFQAPWPSSSSSSMSSPASRRRCTSAASRLRAARCKAERPRPRSWSLTQLGFPEVLALLICLKSCLNRLGFHWWECAFRSVHLL